MSAIIYFSLISVLGGVHPGGFGGSQTQYSKTSYQSYPGGYSNQVGGNFNFPGMFAWDIKAENDRC